MPTPQLNTLYKCGLDSAQLSADALVAVRQALDEAGQQLFAKVQLPLSEPLSSSLMPQAPALAQDGTVTDGAASAAQAGN